jgi:hypothetical protein
MIAAGRFLMCDTFNEGNIAERARHTLCGSGFCLGINVVPQTPWHTKM